MKRTVTLLVNNNCLKVKIYPWPQKFFDAKFKAKIRKISQLLKFGPNFERGGL